MTRPCVSALAAALLWAPLASGASVTEDSAVDSWTEVVALLARYWPLLCLLGLSLLMTALIGLWVLRRTRSQLRHSTAALRERVKELRTLYRSAQLLNDTADRDRVLRAWVHLLPPSLQYPELGGARLTLGADVAQTEQWDETARGTRQRVPISGDGREYGYLEVGYRPDPSGAAPEFSPEENKLFELLAAQLAGYLGQVRALRELAGREQYYRRLVENSLIGIALADEQGRITYSNERIGQLLGWSREELLQQDFTAFIPPDSVCPVQDHGKTVGYSPLQVVKELQLTRRDGESIWVMASLSPLYEDDGTPHSTLVLLSDVTELRRAQGALQATEERYRRIVETSQEGMIATDAQGDIIYANSRLAEMLDWARDDLLGTSVFDLMPAARADRMREQYRALAARSDEQPHRFELELQCRDGSRIWVRASVRPLYDDEGLFEGVFATWSDITAEREAAATLRRRHKQLQHAHEQLKRLQARMVQSEKMASLGELAAGVAHEINNPIGYLKSNLGTLERYCEILAEAMPAAERAGASAQLSLVLEDLPALLTDCNDGVARVEEIVRGLRSFAYQDAQEWQRADLHEVVDAAVRLAWNELKYHVELEKDYAELPPIDCRPSQLTQVFVNLLVNAAHAITERGRVRLRSRALGPDWVQVEVEDSGDGIDPEVLERIFDPFFTTKPVGKGTGLGLSVSYGIIEAHSGRIDARSTPGEGTTFRVVLPVRQDQAGQTIEAAGGGPAEQRDSTT